MLHQFNTGRGYTQDGQIITVAADHMVDEWGDFVACRFHDESRMISGVIRLDFTESFSQSDFMAKYDKCEYSQLDCSIDAFMQDIAIENAKMGKY